MPLQPASLLLPSVFIRMDKRGKAYKTLKMKKMGDERWGATVKGDLKGKFYTFDIGKGETPGTFAKAVGVNGNRGAIVDLYDTDPCGMGQGCAPCHPIASRPRHLRAPRA